jgi:hypothetical protein
VSIDPSLTASSKLHHPEAPQPVTTLFRVDSRRYKLRDCQLLEKYAWNNNLNSPVPLSGLIFKGRYTSYYKSLQPVAPSVQLIAPLSKPVQLSWSFALEFVI